MSLKVFITQLDRFLCNLVHLHNPSSFCNRLDYWHPEIPDNPNDSVILSHGPESCHKTAAVERPVQHWVVLCFMRTYGNYNNKEQYMSPWLPRFSKPSPENREDTTGDQDQNKFSWNNASIMDYSYFQAKQLSFRAFKTQEKVLATQFLNNNQPT